MGFEIAAIVIAGAVMLIAARLTYLGCLAMLRRINPDAMRPGSPYAAGLRRLVLVLVVLGFAISFVAGVVIGVVRPGG